MYRFLRINRLLQPFCRLHAFRLYSKDVMETSRGVTNRRVFSGIQPTGVPHLGNYLGAIKNWVNLQYQCESIFSIVDLHSITMPQDPVVLRENIFVTTASLLASGIDPEKCILFQQSSISEHTELAWILGCLCTIPRLGQLAQWKDKSKTLKDPSLGLFIYPILQTADILLYKATDVPVGEDQVHHITLARDLVHLFNNRYKAIFPVPNNNTGEIAKIRSLKHPNKKMSKSEISNQGRIDLTDTADEIHKKIKRSVTDLIHELTYDPEDRPGVSNLIDIHASLMGLTNTEVVREVQEMNKVQYKEHLTALINETIQPIRKELLRLLDDRHYLQSVLDKGQDSAKTISMETMREVKQCVGFR